MGRVLTARARRARAADAGMRGVPPLLVLPALVGSAFLILPTAGLLVRAPWRALPRIYSDSGVLAALKLSLQTATAATVLSLVLGVPLAWLLARLNRPGIRLLRVAVTMPLVLPPVAGGVALFAAFGRRGIVGQYLDSWFGISIPFTRTGVVLAEAFVAMPFLVVTVEGAFRTADRALEEAALTLGASRLGVLRRVTLPLIVPSLVAGTVLCWARALGEFGATITFNGSLPGVTQTLPILVSQSLETDPAAADALSLVLVALAIVILGSLRDQWLRPAANA